ncbi:DNA polymerase, archaeal type II, large subunit [Methanocella conradii HZ254]|uniref:DNA polymerase II large subunit n=1 Tax=Methanocella conradii (strain DSM 24694 / JCM 17849 / CGMCC 1.5162 / HZ254) TaxID=1041930 RepID=H8I537_METCZ|nr:DNA polymerase II large subunit [Methanocella conradii]AFC99234.1 DNA polymerase, archaeal type II, large subunit [Methanocella conradii HZ254]
MLSSMSSASESQEKYFKSLEREFLKCRDIANRARSLGYDPQLETEVPAANDLAERVEVLMGVPGLAEHIRKCEHLGREEASLQVAADIAEGLVGRFENKVDAIQCAIRTAAAIITEGVVAAPLEGISQVSLAKNDDGSEYIRIYFAGPIRSAGGTAEALSVLAADYVRRKMGLAPYKPRPEEIERYVEEIALYKSLQHLQYTPTDDEIRLIVKNLPVCVDGEPTEDEEVQGYRDLERVETNRVRGGIALVIAEGLILKAPKVKKHVDKLKFDGWEFLDRIIAGSKPSDESHDEKIKPKEKFLVDLIAGRPVFGHPSRAGGFRLRYGRARNTGFAAAGIHPASMVIMDDFIATGTQLKVERPGKAAAIVPVDSIDGPTVKLLNGDVVYVDSVEKALSVRKDVSEILDNGEILINYGDFLENNHVLLPSPYVVEWWEQDLALRTADAVEVRSARDAFAVSEKYGVPLHPRYTLMWRDISADDLRHLREYISREGRVKDGLRVPVEPRSKRSLELLLLPHRVRDGVVLVDDDGSFLLLRCLGLNPDLSLKDVDIAGLDPLEAVSKMSGVKVMDRALSRIGARMGRPEKSKMREMKPPVHVLFPVGEAGGAKRSLEDAAAFTKNMNDKAGLIEVEMGRRKCPECGAMTFKCRCDCGAHTEPYYWCPDCKLEGIGGRCPRCGRPATTNMPMRIDLKGIYTSTMDSLGVRGGFEILKGVQGLISSEKTPEPLEKGVLRALHGVYVFKDGTVRYDLSDVPLTHFRPRELGLSIEKLKELGYEKDVQGRPPESLDQVFELKVQDVILSHDCSSYLIKVAGFIDDMLEKLYGLPRFYNVTREEDLVGHLVIGLAPHTSAGVLGRIIGFTGASAGYAHPFFHAAKRRNCDGDEDCVMLLMDGLINFSRSYLPDRRGGKMDAPLVLSMRIDPKEVDKESHNIDVMARYPREFYLATLEYKSPKDVEKMMDLVSGRLGTPAQYEGFLFTHDTSDIAAGPTNSAYKTLGSMEEKLRAQLELGRRLRAVDERDVAERVINSHFLPDLIGNLRAFSTQQMRCVKCGARYRRPPLSGTCPKCGGRVILTVHEGAVTKYMEVSIAIARDYGVSNYTLQRLELLSLSIKSLFENDKSKQVILSDFM